MTATDPPEGRLVTRVVVKRNNPRLIDVYGHWWVEIDGVESYGWWPATRPLSIPKALRGVAGALNGMGGPGGGSPTVDPRHGELADHAFQPTASAARTDEEIVTSVRRFAAGFKGGWRWSTRPTVNCRSFQADLLAAAGLVVPDGYGHTAGGGCPFLAPPRRWHRQLASRRQHRGRRPVQGRTSVVALAVLVLLFATGRHPPLHPAGRLDGVGCRCR